jgi:cytochrome P450
MILAGASIEGLTSYTVLHLLTASFILYLAGLAFHRLFLSPIACFPGPRLAALTQWYEFYYNVILPGQFFLHIETLHDKYGRSRSHWTQQYTSLLTHSNAGPIIRINPWELHIRDPDFYDTIYSATARRDKVLAHQWQGSYGSVVNTVDHDLHKQRRKALNPYFGKRQLQHFGTFIQSRADKICERVSQ